MIRYRRLQETSRAGPFMPEPGWGRGQKRLRRACTPRPNQPDRSPTRIFPAAGEATPAAWRACGRGSWQDHSGRAGIIGSNEQVTLPPLPCNGHSVASHPLRDLPPHRGIPARRPQRDPDPALPPRPSRSTRHPVPVVFRRLPALRRGYCHRRGMAGRAYERERSPSVTTPDEGPARVAAVRYA